ncbi:MFS polyamine transporter [Panus rudis PR-1116 ss-1]|nr:MFS polyamine transporter [Panus rudis PR-1116 ss-1]
MSGRHSNGLLPRFSDDSPGNSTSATPTLRGEDAVDVPLKQKSPEHPNPEAQPDTSDSERQSTFDQNDPNVTIVDWDGPNDPQNPKNWTYRKKWAATAIVSAFTFISPVSSSMIAPASTQLAEEFGITDNVVIALTTSVFVLAYAFGPLFLGPLSEIYGRSRVLQLSNLWYLAWNLGCGFAQNKGQLIAFRFLSGLGGSAPLSIGGGLIGDCWRTEERGKAIALYSLAPLLGPVIGPVAGAWIAEKSTWRWVFWSTTIVDGFIQCLGLIFLKETFAPLLLERKANRIRKSMDPEKADGREVRTIFDGADRHWKNIVAKALVRPFALFVREPIVQLLGVYMAFIYGLLYLFLTTIPGIFEGVYHERVGIAGLHYIALGVGLTGASQINARSMDKIYMYFKKKNGGNGRPEFRLPPMFPGTILLPAGLFITGWTARADVHWIAPDIGIALVGAGVILNFQSIQTYVIDTFTLHAASALAAVAFLRSLAGFGFPLFAPAMYKALGYGKGDTILAVVAIVVGCPAPWLFWHYGERVRKLSKYARN